MDDTPLYEFDDEQSDRLIRIGFKVLWGAEVVSRSEGAFGSVYRLDKGKNVFPRYLAAKCPKLRRFGSSEKAVEAFESSMRELEKTYAVFSSPWVNRFFDIQIIHGWPFFISKWHDGTLADLIGNPLAWTLTDRLSSLLLIVRALRQAKVLGIAAHQDLKPENIFFADLHRKFPGLIGSSGLHYQILVGDFGNADAFLDDGRNTGTRPYMAPEQFQSENLDAATGPALDVFAIGVIAHECLCDGVHPIGTVTSDVWPRRKGVSRKWGEKDVWRDWAASDQKDFSSLRERAPINLLQPLSDCLASDPSKRPTLEELEDHLWKTLVEANAESAKDIRLQVEWLESLYQAESWPHFEERLDALRRFYARRSS